MLNKPLPALLDPKTQADYLIELQDSASVKRAIINYLVHSVGKDPAYATSNDWFYALAFMVRGVLSERYINTTRERYGKNVKRVYYLSMEYLLGRSLTKNLIDLNLLEFTRQALAEVDQDYDKIAAIEHDPGLGNGGLGRLAACYLESMATLGLPGGGYGLRYEFGLFSQGIENGAQVEHPDNWLKEGNPWEFRRPDLTYEVHFGGTCHCQTQDDGTRTITDEQGTTSTATVTITINGQNDTPVADDDAPTISEDAGATDITATLLAGDTDADAGETATLAITAINTTGTVGTVTLSSGIVTYNPNGQFEHLGVTGTATDTFTYTITDAQGATSTATVTVTIDGQNDAPFADDDSFSVNEDDGATNVTATLLAGDDGGDFVPPDLVSITAVNTTGTVGAVVLNSGTVTYNPNGQFQSLKVGQTTTDTFAYTISDSQAATASATMTVTITGQNDTPTANNDTINISEDAGATTITPALKANDTDPDSGETSTLVVSSIDATGVVGTLTLNAGVVKYNPNGQFESLKAGETANVTFTYTVKDVNNATSAAATATLVIQGANDAPVADGDNVNIDEDDPALDITATLLAGDTDADAGQTATLVISAIDTTLTQGQVTLSSGTVTYNTGGQLQWLTVTDSVEDQFTYTVRDVDGNTSQATVTVTIQGQNDLPTDMTLSPRGLPANAAEYTFIGSLQTDDPDADPYEYTLVTGAGDTDNALFSVDYGSVQVKAGVLDVGAGPWSIRVQADDTHGGTITKAFTILPNTKPSFSLDGDNSGGNAPEVYLTYNEGDPATAIHDGITLTDPDGDNIDHVNVFLSAPNMFDEELTVTLSYGITLDAESTSTNLLLRGSATPAQYAEVLESIRYVHHSNRPSAGQRYISYEVSDGISESVFSNSVVDVIPVVTAAQLDLDADNSSGGGGSDYNATFMEASAFQTGSGPVPIADTDLTISDVNGTTIDEMKLYVRQVEANDVITPPSLPGGITVSQATVGDDLVVTFTGTADHDAYKQLIRGTTFNNTGSNFNSLYRRIDVELNDGDEISDIAGVNISILEANEPVVIDLDDDDSSGATGGDFATSFTEAGTSTAGTGPVAVVDSDITITDPDGGTTLDFVTISISNLSNLTAATSPWSVASWIVCTSGVLRGLLPVGC